MVKRLIIDEHYGKYRDLYMYQDIDFNPTDAGSQYKMTVFSEILFNFGGTLHLLPS